jgi:hypothetical protein
MTYHNEENVEVTIRDAESSINRAAPHSVPPTTKPLEEDTTCSSRSSTWDDYSCVTIQIKNSMSCRSPNNAELHKEVSASRRRGKGWNGRSGFFLCLRPPKARRAAKRNRSSSQDYPDFEDPPRLNLPQYSDMEEDLLRDDGHSVLFADSLVERFIVVYYNRDADLFVEDCHAGNKTVPSMQSLDERQLSEAVEMVLDSQRLEKVQRQVLLEPTGNFQLLYWGIALTQY